jgi:hypothetical protein
MFLLSFEKRFMDFRIETPIVKKYLRTASVEVLHDCSIEDCRKAKVRDADQPVGIPTHVEVDF